jgi:hypothetical protein
MPSNSSVRTFARSQRVRVLATASQLREMGIGHGDAAIMPGALGTVENDLVRVAPGTDPMITVRVDGASYRWNVRSSYLAPVRGAKQAKRGVVVGKRALVVATPKDLMRRLGIAERFAKSISGAEGLVERIDSSVATKDVRMLFPDGTRHWVHFGDLRREED